MAELATKLLPPGLVALVAAMVPAVLGAGGVAFHPGPLDRALQEAERDGRMVFVWACVDWSWPCRLMDANVFVDGAVGKYFNSRFLNLRLDPDATAADAAVADRYEIVAYPTLLFLRSDGWEVGRAVGGLGARQLERLGKDLAKDQAVETFRALARRYYEGDRDRAFVRTYLQAIQVEQAKRRGQNQGYFGIEREHVMTVFETYVANADGDALVNAADFEIIVGFKELAMRGDRAVEFVIDNYDDFAEVAPENALSAFVLGVNWRTVRELAGNANPIYRTWLDELDRGLERAASFMAAIDPASPLLGAYQEDVFVPMYLAKVRDWAGLERWVAERTAQPATDQAQLYYRAAGYMTLAATDPRTEVQARSRYRTLALAYGEQGHRLDPENALGAYNYASALAMAGQRDQAIAILEAVVVPAQLGHWKHLFEDKLAELRGEPRSPRY